MNDLYEELGVDRDATDQEIKDAYRQQAKENHPDKKEGNEDKMVAINKAWNILSNPEKKRKYDETGETEESPFIQRFIGFMNQLFLQVIAECRNVNNTNLVQTLKLLVDQTEQNTANALIGYEKQMNNFDNIKNRLSTKKDNTLIMILEENIKQCKKQIAAINNELEFIQQSKDVLNDYDYVIDIINQEAPITNGSFFISSGSYTI